MQVTLTVRSEEGPGVVNEDRVTDSLHRYDDYGRPFGSVFNLHPEHSRIFVGGFPSDVQIQASVRETFMVGQVEGLEIGGQPIGLWNYKKANNILGAPARSGEKEREKVEFQVNMDILGFFSYKWYCFVFSAPFSLFSIPLPFYPRNRFKAKPAKGVRFGGDGYIALDSNNYVDMNEEMSVKFKFKPDSPNGLLFLAGSPADRDFVSLELRDGYLVYAFNLGDGTVAVESPEQYELGMWLSVELGRTERWKTKNGFYAQVQL